MPNAGFSYPWEIDDLAISKSGHYSPGYEAERTFGRPGTDADRNSATKTSLGVINAAGKPTRDQIQGAMRAQFDF